MVVWLSTLLPRFLFLSRGWPCSSSQVLAAETTFQGKKGNKNTRKRKRYVQFKQIETNSPLNIGVYKLQFVISPKPVSMISVDVDAWSKKHTSLQVNEAVLKCLSQRIDHMLVLYNSIVFLTVKFVAVSEWDACYILKLFISNTDLVLSKIQVCLDFGPYHRVQSAAVHSRSQNWAYCPTTKRTFFKKWLFGSNLQSQS